VTKVRAIIDFFSTPERPVTRLELMDLKNGISQVEWDKIAKECAIALGGELDAN